MEIWVQGISTTLSHPSEEIMATMRQNSLSLEEIFTRKASCLYSPVSDSSAASRNTSATETAL